MVDGTLKSNPQRPILVRVGHGYDAHRFGEGSEVRIGGISVPHSRGVVAHSDGDVVIHALCDAILGALGLGDLGARFPDSDPAYAGVDSRSLLKNVASEMRTRGWVLANADATIVAQTPRLSPYIALMCEALSDDLGAGIDQVNVKATTTEGMGFVGREEGLACHVVVILIPD